MSIFSHIGIIHMKITGKPFVDKFILKLIWQSEVPRITKATLKGKN